MLGFWVLAGWGAAGAFVYAANALIFGIWNDGATRAARIRSMTEFTVSILTGSIAAAGLTRPLVSVLDAGLNLNGFQFRLDPDQVAVALTIGWVSNYLWPKLLRKIGARVDTLGDGKSA